MSEKNYTLRSVTNEIEKTRKSIDSKQENIKKLTVEIKTEKKKLKELEHIYTTLHNESLQRQIATAWFKDKTMTPEQIEKFLELSMKIQDKIDILNVSDMVDAVTTAYNEHQSTETKESNDTKKVDTNINFSNTKTGGTL